MSHVDFILIIQRLSGTVEQKHHHRRHRRAVVLDLVCSPLPFLEKVANHGQVAMDGTNDEGSPTTIISLDNNSTDICKFVFCGSDESRLSIASKGMVGLGLIGSLLHQQHHREGSDFRSSQQ